jgi:tetratricopeptide (TPR) repeat protein
MYIGWNFLLYTARGNFSSGQWSVHKLSDIGETYENELAKAYKFLQNTYLLMKYRRLNDGLGEVDTGIQFISKTGFRVWLIHLYSVKARIQLMLGDVTGAMDSLGRAENIKSEVTGVPTIEGSFASMRFILDLYQLEEAINKADKTASSLNRANALRAGNEALKVASKFAVIKTETLKLMGVYYWVVGKQRKAMRWWRKAIHEGQRLNDRLELSRTYYEVGKRLLDPKSKYKELDGIKAEEYLKKAKTMFVEMDLQWDLDELEKLKIQLGS